MKKAVFNIWVSVISLLWYLATFLAYMAGVEPTVSMIMISSIFFGILIMINLENFLE